MAQTRSKTRWPRMAVIILLVLLVLYSVLGFVALPWWLERQVPEQLSQQLGWKGSVQNIAINPFALSLEITGLKAQDGGPQPVLDIERLYVNLGFWSLFRGIAAIQEITLDQPGVRLDLLPGYELKVARDWLEHNPAREKPPEEGSQDSGEPPQVYLQQLTVNGGSIMLRDLTGDKHRSFPVAPLNLSLNDLATWRREEGGSSSYYLLAAIGSQTIEWQGSLGLLPLESDGFLKVSDLEADTLTHFLAEQIPLDLREGLVTVSSDYRLRSGDTLQLDTSGGEVTLENLAVASEAGQAEPELSSNSIALKDIAFSLQQRSLETGKLRVEGLTLSLLRNAEGELPLLTALQAQTTSGQPEETKKPGSSDAPPFRWSVEGVELAGSQVSWLDRVPAMPADLRLNDIRVELGPLSDDLAEPVRYKVQSVLGGGGQLSATGQVSAAPLNLEAALSGSDLALTQFQPYLQESANLALEKGSLQLEGQLDLDGQDAPLTGTFSGQGQVTDLAVRLTDSAEPMVTWQTLRLENIQYNLVPARLEIGTVTLAEPSVSVIRNANGIHNLQQISGNDGTAPEGEASGQPSPEASEQGKEAGPPFIFRISQLLLDKGQLAYTDRSMEPPFATRLTDLQGSVTGITNVKPQQGQVNISGTLAGNAPVTIKGSLGTLGSDELTELHLTLENYPMPGLSPYFGNYLGYRVDSGKLGLDLDYRFRGAKIDASNLVIMDQLALGKKVESPDTVGVPVKLGLALLRDQKGVIDIRLPISGDMSAPSFDVSEIVGQAFINVLRRAATSPFTMLGSLVDLAGFSAEELGQVSFAPGESAIREPQSKQLAALADALRQRPALMLSIRGAVAPKVDEPALRRQRLLRHANIEPSMSPGQRLPGLERTYQERVAEPPLATLRQQVNPDDERAWEAALLERLLPTVQLPPEALGQLASARAEAVRTELQDEHSAASAQLFLQDPDRQAPLSDNGDVLVQFNLEAR
ncbi:DUF748 domain-containing protein [Marinobacter sp.]|uniref:DUF748 domain-containing protein n=1 Tax=Marinobacter sp. TaxID=50741 RepID=UPI0019A0C3D8|nr:DUF748 domain-containing protein [Marinobacter sp.]MBC7191551.1 DUF748 domain-containing protein [Marinobacter sp.]